MKKIWITTLLALVIAILVAGPASAQKDKINIKGEVVSIGEGTLTVLSNKGETFMVVLPAGFDLSAIQVGASILVKGSTAPNGSIQADSIKLLGNKSQNENQGNEDDQEPSEGLRENHPFCAEGRSHPLAPKLAERYGVTEEWVMSRFCEGYSFGAIMLALRTSQMEGITAPPDEILMNRAAGIGWGRIWKELGLIGSEKEGHSPPGLLKKPDHAGPKNK